MSDPFIAEIIMFGGNFAPRGWAFCDGQLLPISQYTALFSLVGTVFGGDGRTTFGLPEARRTMVHPGSGPGLATVNNGEKSGQNNTTIGVNNLPAHSHAFTIGAVDDSPNQGSPAPTNHLAQTSIYSNDTVDVQLGGGTTANAGGGQHFNNMQPYIGIYHIIALQGVFPSRN